MFGISGVLNVTAKYFDADNKEIYKSSISGLKPPTRIIKTVSGTSEFQFTEQEHHIFVDVARTEYLVNIQTEITHMLDTYVDLFHVLTEAKENDTVTITIACYGGDVNVGVAIINAMKACKVPIHMIVTGPIYSMAPIIALTADTIEIRPLVFFMFHDYSGGVYGKGNELESTVKNDRRFNKEILQQTCTPFLTTAEVKKISDGKDLYISAKDLPLRLKRHRPD